MISPVPSWLGVLLYPAGLLYEGAVRGRNALYQRGTFGVRRAGIPVVSIGNLTVGGSGKTPFTAYLASRLSAQGRLVAIASRGYGGRPHEEPLLVSEGRGCLVTAREAGDEPVLFASSLPGVGVVVCKDRFKAAEFARQRLGVEVVLLDDGFQHRSLARSCDLLLVEAEERFGNGKMLPRGPLREPLAEMARADALVVTGHPERLMEGGARLKEIMARQGVSRPVFFCARRFQGFSAIATGELLPPAALSGLKAVAFSGIARPEAFEADLRSLGIDLLDALRFRDHQALGGAEMAAIRELAGRLKPDVLITTEKDKARMGEVTLPLPSYALRIQLQPDDERELLALVGQRLDGHPDRAAQGGR
jgi:tetraacyldisaccharide 4'-kinase